MTSHLWYTRWTINSFWIFFKVPLPTMMLVIDVQEKCWWHVIDHGDRLSRLRVGNSHIVMSIISLWPRNSFKRLKNIPTPEPFIGKSPRLLLITELGPRWNLLSLFNLSLPFQPLSHLYCYLQAQKWEKCYRASSSISLPKLKLVELVHLFQQELLKNISTADTWHNLVLISNLIPKMTKISKVRIFRELSLKSTFIFES